MAEKTKEEELKQKLLDFFDKKLTDLTTKFQNDIDAIEKMKYECLDEIIKKLEEIEEEHKKEEGQENEKQEKEKPEKKAEEQKHEKVPAKKKIDPTARPKTPLASTKRKGKEDKGHDTSEIHKKDAKGKTGGTHPPAGGKTPVSKKTDKKTTTAKADPRAKTATKKGAANAKKAGAGGAKGGKKDAKKGDKEKKEEEKKEEEPEVEEKKPILLNPKFIYTLSDELKNNPGLSCLYFVLKGKYLDKKNTLHITTYSPLLYKNMGSMKYLLDDKKKEVQAKADEIEKFLNNYGDLNTY